MIKTLPITTARNELPELAKNAAKKMDEYIITVNGLPAAAIISADEYESWKETEEILANKELMKAIKTGEDELDEGKGITLEELEKSRYKLNREVHDYMQSKFIPEIRFALDRGEEFRGKMDELLKNL